QAEDGIRDFHVTGVQTCALPILSETIDVLHKDQYLDYLRTTNPTSPILVDPISGVDRDFTNIPNRDWQDELYVTAFSQNHSVNRSEERRVGKECRYRWTPYRQRQ